MAVGLLAPSTLRPVKGVRVGTCAADLRYPDRPDLVVFELAPGSETAAVFTRNRFCAAPVTVARDHLARTQPRALLINTGYANAGTGNRITSYNVCYTKLLRQSTCDAGVPRYPGFFAKAGGLALGLPPG